MFWHQCLFPLPQAQPPQSQGPKEGKRQNCLHLAEPRSHSHTSWALLCAPCPTAAVQIKGEHTWARDALTAVQQRGVWFRVSWLLYYTSLADHVTSLLNYAFSLSFLIHKRHSLIKSGSWIKMMFLVYSAGKWIPVVPVRYS